MNVKNTVQRGNIVRMSPDPDSAGCYQANGRFGAVFGEWGLNRDPGLQRKDIYTGRSLFSHMGHWGRFRFLSEATGQETTADYLLPLFYLHWETEPCGAAAYRQTQDFYDGTVETAFAAPQTGTVSVLSWFDWADKDLAGFRIETEREIALLVSAADAFIPYPFLYKRPTAQQSRTQYEQGQWSLSAACGDTINQAASRVYFKTTGTAVQSEKGLRVILPPGAHFLFVSYGRPVQDEADSLVRTVNAWHGLWERSGLMDISDDRAQQLFIRSLAYLLCSYGDDYGPIQPTCGMTGNMFPFHFVQDMEYIAPALTMTGHGEIVRRWVEHFARLIPDMQRYVRRLWPGSEGIYPPWELPYGDMDGYHVPAMPVPYCYEPHNVGYLCRMAVEAGEAYGSESWMNACVKPLIRECAAFYRSAAKKEEDGCWHLRWLPSIGQDEAGGRNGKDYLCSLYSAAYCFQSAVRYGVDEEGVYAGIMRDGLAFPALSSEDGVYHTARGADDRGRQKHPIQLDGLSFMPIHPAPLPEEEKAYSIRYQLTDRAKEPFFYGWTLGEFLLSGANLGDRLGFVQDWNCLRRSDYTDRDWTQIYESSGQAEKSYYVTTHGMVLQSLIRLAANDYWGDLRIASCPVWERVSFRNLRTRLGAVVSGEWTEGSCRFTITAQRDCTVCLPDGNLRLRAGDTAEKQFSIR